MANRWSWLLAVPPLVVWAVALLQFARLNAADQRLYHAAAAAVQEAVLPRASRMSVVLAAQRTLARPLRQSSPNIELQINARPAKSRWIDCRSGDTVSVTLAADPRFFVPDLLRAIGMSQTRLPPRVTAVMQKP